MAEASNTQLTATGQTLPQTTGAANPLQQGLQSDVLKKLLLLVGLAASIAIGFAVVLWTMQPNYSMLYGNLSGADAQSVVEVLQQQQIPYKLDAATGAVMVPAGTLHDIRLSLASEGLPRGTGVGFEALQQESGFGTSQFIETARYHRSLEVELARSISKINAVRSARVHLGIPKTSVFIRDRKKPSASVAVNLHQGRQLERNQVEAITHLVASGVPNMEVSSVTVIDQKGRLLSGNKKSDQLAQSKGQLEYMHQLEQRYIDRILNILTPIVGRGRVQAQVATDVDFTVIEQTQELYNPDSSALRSQQQSEEHSNGFLGGGIPGALANQPPGGAVAPEQVQEEAGNELKKSGNSRRQSTSNYELDKTISHTRMAAGNIKRLSVAVVIDDRLLAGGEQRRHSPEEIQLMTQLVKEAVGFDPRRGDSVSFSNVAFNSPEAIPDLPEVPLMEQPWIYDLGKYIVAALALILVYIGLLRPVMRGLFAPAVALAPAAGASSSAGLSSLEGADPENLTPGQRQALLEASDEEAAKLLVPPRRSHEEQLKDIRKVVDEEPQLVAEVVKGWMGNE
ncbi:MAG: flagellar M-ring protein FliF [Gammaproteobacteria bacterium]|nr:flagellar M-ring protein FliF [Gammaproteobacteria bacterium]MCF6229945.1 flagellar M-ring protein FliF [Gammaproteobacteria bacterium]